MTRTITPEEKIWDYLRGMSCTASSAIDDWSNINFAISEAFSFLSPLSGLGFIQDDTHELEKHLIELEAAAETIIKTYETRDALRKLKTRRNNRAKEQNGKKTWEHLKEEDANERRN